MKSKCVSVPFVVLTMFYCVALVVSNVIAGKLWAAPFGLVLTTGVWLFPIVYIIGDVVPEVYGLARARQVILLGFAANLFAVCFFLLCIALPAPGFFANQSAFEIVLGFTPRLLFASFCGYLVGTNANALVMVRMKRWTSGRYLWTRTIGSTVVGESLDSLIFVSIAFWGVIAPEAVLTTIVSMAIFKIAYEIAATPLTYAIVSAFKKYEGEDRRASYEGLDVPETDLGLAR